MIRRLMLTLFLAGVVCAVAVAFVAQQRWQKPLQVPPQGYHLEVSSGERFRAVVMRLTEAGVVSAPYVLIAYGRWTGLDEKIKKGEYRIKPGIVPVELLELLTTGAVIQYQVTLPEGITLGDAITMLADNATLQQSVSGPQDEKITNMLGQYQNPEGLFFPDSYSFEKGAVDIQILQRAMSRMQQVLTQEWSARAEDLP